MACPTSATWRPSAIGRHCTIVLIRALFADAGADGAAAVSRVPLAAQSLGLLFCHSIYFHFTLHLQMLALTARLRYHDLPYIRALAAQALGLLFRHASSSALRAGLRAVAAEAAARPASRTEPAGQVHISAWHGWPLIFGVSVVCDVPPRIFVLAAGVRGVATEAAARPASKTTPAGQIPLLHTCAFGLCSRCFNDARCNAPACQSLSSTRWPCHF